MRRNWLVIILAIVVGVILVVIGAKFRHQIKLILNKKSREKEVPSMLRALPFKEKPKKREKSLLLSSLKENQMLLMDLLATPKNAPKGLYLRVSVVLDLSSPQIVEKYRKHQAKLEEIIIESVQHISYRDLLSSEGPRLLKAELEKRFQKILKKHINELWITRYEFQKMRRL